MLDEQVELVAIELPGRGRRMNEKPYADLHQLIRDLKAAMMPLLDKPFMLFGHSMGGLIAFELTRDLRMSGLAQPMKLFISSTPGLTTYTRREVDHTLSNEELIKIFPHLDKTNIGDDELHQLLVDQMRTDLRLLNNYSYTKEPALDIPMVIIYGAEDERVREDQAEKWRDETSSSCHIIQRAGGHRYIDHDGAFLTSLIQSEVVVPVIIRKIIDGAL